MDRTVLLFIKSGMIYLLAGTALGFFLLNRQFIVLHPGYTTAHAHLNLVGFVMMLIYGVGYHILPRFSGKPLYSQSIAKIHFFLANLGLIGMVTTFILESSPAMTALKAAAGLTLAASLALFVVNIWLTIPKLAEAAPPLTAKKPG